MNGFHHSQNGKSDLKSLLKTQAQTNRQSAMEAVRQNPTSHQAWYALGRVLALAGEADKARECFTRAVALDPAARAFPKESKTTPTLPDWLT